MTEDSEDSGDQDNPLTLLKTTQKRLATNKILLIVVLVISALVTTVMATGMTVMFIRISAMTEAMGIEEEDPMEDQFIALEQQLMLLADFRKSELKKISAYTKQLEKIASNCSVDNEAPYKDFLLSREQDFQKLLGTIKTGSASLAGMSLGSKKWLDVHIKSLEDLEESSVERKIVLEKLLKGRK
ncbi:MAG: hypothetical protein ACJAYG_002382 [Oceanicoccus sp.]|jgi:hypothetical protein